jgi:pyruvate-ferredoxin/flavodoxin oxidoreductase
MAVESRTSPVFVHDPRGASDMRGRFSLDGNPDADKDWATNTIEYVEDGATKLLEAPMTPADFALTEGRFKKQFRRLAADAVGVPVHEYIDLSAADQQGKTPFVWSTDDDKKLIKLEVAPTLIHLVHNRRKNWRTLQYLSGLDVAKLDADHQAELEALQRQYKESLEARESSIDSIARAMSELAASSNAPPAGGFAAALTPGAGAAATATAAANGSALVTLADDDLSKCNNCKTCYQDVPELFEKSKIVVDGVTKEVGHLIPGALDRVKITPELKAKVARLAANCDAEIIHAH